MGVMDPAPARFQPTAPVSPGRRRSHAQARRPPSLRYRGVMATTTDDAGGIARAAQTVVTSLARQDGDPVPPSLAMPGTRNALAVIIPGFAGFAALTALVRRKRVEALDMAISMRLQAIHHPLLDRTLRVVSWFGFPPQSRLIPPIAIAAVWLTQTA